MTFRPNALASTLLVLALSIMAATAQQSQAQRVSRVPRPDHVIIVIEENKSYEQIIGNKDAPYINGLARKGALFTNSYALTHPSQPNYLALFSGSTHGVQDDRCPLSLTGPNLATELRNHGLTFAIYSESLPAVGYDGCASPYDVYARKHNPAVNWQGRGLPQDINLPMDAMPSDFSSLPTVSIVVPNQLNDMHDGQTVRDAIARGDAWLRTNLDSYVRWLPTHNSLLILTWDEDDGSSNNHIATIFVGPMVKPGEYTTRINHYSVLKTLADMYGLTPVGNSAQASPITDVWTTKQ
jgi:acid phosphatase